MTEALWRPPSAIRKVARLAFAERIPVLTGIADDEEAKAIDRIRAIEMLGKYGGVERLALVEEEQPVTGPPTQDHVAEMWERIQRIKSVEALEKLLVDTASRKKGQQCDRRNVCTFLGTYARTQTQPDGVRTAQDYRSSSRL